MQKPALLVCSRNRDHWILAIEFSQTTVNDSSKWRKKHLYYLSGTTENEIEPHRVAIERRAQVFRTIERFLRQGFLRLIEHLATF